MNTLTIDIRKAEPRDAAAIADVHYEAWTGAYSGIIPHRALIRMIGRRGAEWWANAIRRAAMLDRSRVRASAHRWSVDRMLDGYEAAYEELARDAAAPLSVLTA